jgi:CO/xanthine dehydrogenase Mo-binding subunit
MLAKGCVGVLPTCRFGALVTSFCERTSLPLGPAKCALPAFAPAIDNAILAATGIRLRSLPTLPKGKLPKVKTGS